MLQLLALLPLCLSSPSLEVVLDWSHLPHLPIAWPNSSWAVLHGDKKASVIGIKVQQGRVFLTLPRWHGNSHPLNLAELSATPGLQPQPSAPSLRPFPSWEAQKLWDWVNLSKRGGKDGVFQGLAGLLRGKSRVQLKQCTSLLKIG